MRESSTKSAIGKPESNSLKHNFITKISIPFNNFTPYLKGQWQGNRYAGDDSIGEYYKNVFLMTAGGTYAFNDSWKLNVAIHNLLDKKFTDSFARNSRGNYVPKYNKIEEGRRFWVSLTGNF